MAVEDVLTRELVFRWDASRRRLLVLDGERAQRQIAEVDYATLDAMSWVDASKFVGDFVTLLVPELRERYAREFPTDE